MDVLGVVKEDIHLREIWGFTPAWRRNICTCGEVRSDFKDSLCPCKVHLKVTGDVISDEGLDKTRYVKRQGRCGAESTHRDFLCLCARYWPC